MSSVVPEAWEEKELSLLTNIVFKKTEFNNQFEALTSSRSGLFRQSEYFNKRVTSSDNTGYRIIAPGQFTFRAMSDDGTFKFNRSNYLFKGIVSPAYEVFEVTNCVPDFLDYMLNSDKFHQKIYANAQGGTRLTLKYSSLSKLKVLCPNIPEQKKIASILTSVDEVIETTQKQIDKLQDLKKATMNELLTKGIGHTEFKDSELGRIPKSWEVSIVRNSIKNMTSGWSPDCLPDPAVGSQWGVLKTTAVTWNGFDITENKALPSHLDGRIQISLKAGDVLITRAGPIDRVGVVAFCNETYPKIMLSDKVIRIQSKSDELMGEFLSIWLSSYAAQQNMRSKISGMAEAQSNISQDILKSIPVPLPNLSEQKKIVQILRSVDMRIEVQKNKLCQTQSLKKSLMQDLLTGKVRVQVN